VLVETIYPYEVLNPIVPIFFLVAALLLLNVSRQWAPLPFLAGAGYMTLGQEFPIGPLHFTMVRLLITVGLLRVLYRGERIWGGVQRLDRILVFWGCCAVFSGFFHEDFSASFVARVALCYDTLGIYFLFRCFIRSPEEIYRVAKIIIIVLVPVAVEMAIERVIGRNSFSMLGEGVLPMSEVRSGVVRAQGPFLHPILAGTVGAVCWPLLIPVWRRRRWLAVWRAPRSC
jgi:hypothetical protein